MDSNDINVHDATVRRESGGNLARDTGEFAKETSVPPEVEPNETEPAEAGSIEAGFVNQNVADENLDPAALIEEAKTVITSSNPVSVPSQPTSGGSPAEIARVLLGHHLDHFSLETLIGGGGMGAVFRARDTRLDRTVAIKVIPRVGDDPELQRRFRNEAQSAARLDHPNIARVYDVGQHGGWHYIVFEYIDGINLRDLVHRDGILSVDDAVFYTRQVAEAIEHAHRRGVVHRDIKPSNVLITTTGQAKLVDMGLARAQQLDMSEDMTASGVTLGTFDYISPEQARDPRDADVRSDIYSLGCTLYFLLTGQAPYPSGTVLQKLLSHGSSPPPDPRRVRNDLSQNLVAVLHKMLAKQPNDRYRRPLDLISDLSQLAEREHLPRALSAGSITIAPASRVIRIAEHHLPWVAAIALLLISTAWMQLLSSAGSDLNLTEVPKLVDVPVGAAPVLQPSATVPNSKLEGGSESIGGETNIGLGIPGRTVGDASAGAELGIDTRGDAGTQSPDSGRSGSEGLDLTDAGNTSVQSGFPGVPRLAVLGGLGRFGVSDKDSRDGIEIPGSRVANNEMFAVRVVGEGGESSELPADLKGPMLVETLSEAFEAAATDQQYSIIEIDGVVNVSTKVTLPRRGLTIRGVSKESRLVFSESKSGDDQPAAFFDLQSYSVDFEDLPFSWTLDQNRKGIASMFRLDGGNTIRLSNCSITIANPLNAAKAFAFSYVPVDPKGDSVPVAVSDVNRLVAIQLQNCIVRGAMTLLGMERAGLLELRWDNGLLCVEGSMIESRGEIKAAGVPVSSSGIGTTRTRIFMNDVTAALGESLVTQQLTMDGEIPFLVDREAIRCVFSLPASSSILRVVGLKTPQSNDRLALLRGRDNYYDGSRGLTQVILKSTTVDGTVSQFTLDQLLAVDRPAWAGEQSPQGIVNWSRQIPSVGAFSAVLPQDYLQEGVVLPGFRLAELPKLDVRAAGSSSGGI